jgi:membrane protein required for colicin V production
MSFFDLCAGLVLLVSVVTGWFRGATREVTWVAAVVVAAIVAVLALGFTGPIARHAIHVPVLANVVALIVVFVAVCAVLSVAAAALSRQLQQTAVLGTLDRAAGAGIGLVRALVVIGLGFLALGAFTAPDRMPTTAILYPVAATSAGVLRAFAPEGVKLAAEITPVVGHAITSEAGDSNATDDGDTASGDNSAQGADKNRGYNATPSNAVRPRRGSSR